MARIVWKGAISFGLVHVPIAMYPASQETGIDFDWLDDRSMDPVGYQRINKRTGKPIAPEHVVKGVKLGDGDYVVLSDEEIQAAFPKRTQTIAIDAFVKAADLPFTLLERPYYLEPAGKSERVYALLRDAMAAAGVIGIARLVMHNKEHLAALVPTGDALILNTIRWAAEIRPADEIKFPPRHAAAVKPAELKMARQLIADMTTPWKPDAYEDTFAAAVHELVQRKVKAGKAAHVAPLEEATEAGSGSNVVDLTELLTKSLAGRSAGKSAPASAKRKPVKHTARKTAA